MVNFLVLYEKILNYNNSRIILKIMRIKMINLLIRLSKDAKQDLENFCNKRGISQAAACRLALSKFMEKENVT